MVSSPSPMVLALAALLSLAAPLAGAQPVAPALAPAPAPAPLNITAILIKASNHKTFLRLLHDTQVDIQINVELNSSANSFTVFAPSDNAFARLNASTLNTLTQQDQVELVLFHVLARYYGLAMFDTASNPVRTQASGNHGAYTLNVTTDNTLQVNISTGIVQTPIASTLFDDGQQLALYSTEKVLLPYDLFGPKPPPAAPPAPSKAGEKSPSADSADATAPSTNGAGSPGRGAGWSFVVGAALFAIAGSLL